MRGLRLAIVIVVVAPFLGAALLAASAYLPAEPINRNAGTDAVLMVEEGRWPTIPSLYGFRRGDNWTDATMLNISMIDNRDSAVLSTLVASQYVVFDAAGRQDPPRALYERAQLGAGPNATYEWYWHGYVAVYRPLLLVLDYSQLRVLTSVLLSLLAGGVAFQIWRQLGLWAAAVFTIACVPMGALAVGLALTYKTTLVIACLGMLAILYLHVRQSLNEWLLPAAAALGVSAAFFDLLTTPLLTIGLPLLVLAALELSNGRRIPLGKLGVAAAVWGGSYVSMWASKWLLLQVVVGEGIAKGVGKVLERTGEVARDGYVDRLSPLANNLRFLGPGRFAHGNVSTVVEVLVLAGVLTALALLWWALYRYSQGASERARRALPILLFAAAPYAWYLFAANHSFIHAWFTFRLQYLTLVAIGVFFIYSLDWGALRLRVQRR